MKSHIEVTQDGIARITSATSSQIEGIYTEGLETCLAIIMVGRDSCAIIHATSQLSASSVQDEFKQHDVQFWTFAYNPAYYPGGNENEQLQQHLALFIENIEAVTKNTFLKNADQISMRTYAARGGFVSVDRNGGIQTHIKPYPILPPKDKTIRHQINIVNNFFLSDDETIAADIQFDGSQFTLCSTLKKSSSEVTELVSQDNFHSSPLTTTVLKIRNQIIRSELRQHSLFRKIYLEATTTLDQPDHTWITKQISLLTSCNQLNRHG